MDFSDGFKASCSKELADAMQTPLDKAIIDDKAISNPSDVVSSTIPLKQYDDSVIGSDAITFESELQKLIRQKKETSAKHIGYYLNQVEREFKIVIVNDMLSRFYKTHEAFLAY